MIKVEVIKNTELNKRYNITELVQSVSWQGDYKQSARKLDIVYSYSSLDVNVPKFDIQIGCIVILSEDGRELFRGMVYKRNLEGDEISVTCYDDGIRLLKIRGAYNFKNASASDIVAKICSEYSIPRGHIETGGKQITKVFINNSLYDIIMTAYTEVSKSTKKKYMCNFKEGKLQVIEKGITQLTISFEEFKNITSNSFTESIENMVNKVIVVDESGNKISEHSNAEDVKLYGIFQEVIRKTEEMDVASEVSSTYKHIEQNCSLSGYGNTSCLTGYTVLVRDSNTKMGGVFYINADTHTWKNGDYSIELDLSFRNMMHEVSSGQDEVTKPTTSNTTSSANKPSSGSSGGANKPSGGSTSTGSKASNIVKYAKSKLGCKYVWGATGPSQFDCSGLAVWCHKQVGVSIPRSSSAQGKSGYFVARHNLQPGDLVFFNTRGSGISHVGVYIGGNKMVHASNPSSGVRTDDITNAYYLKRFVCGRRYV